MHMNSVRFLLNIGLEKALLLFFGFGLKTKKDKNNSLVDAWKKWKKAAAMFICGQMDGKDGKDCHSYHA